MLCEGCGELLGHSEWRDDLKSCPKCSLRAGRHVFHPLSSFGERTPHGGAPIIQSWCRGCRAGRPSEMPSLSCGKLPAELATGGENFTTESPLILRSGRRMSG